MKKGDICSPQAFICELEGMLRKTKTTERFRTGGEVLQMLLFIDDIVLITKNSQTIQNLLFELKNNVKATGRGIQSERRVG